MSEERRGWLRRLPWTMGFRFGAESQWGSSSVARSALLPSVGLVDTLDMKTPIDLVGYGVQGLVRGGGPPQNGAFGTRQFGQTTLIASNDKLSGDLLKMHSGVCFGDSGGPDLLPGTNVVLGVNSFVNDGVCAGVTYSARVDTPAVLAWIAAASSRFAT